jgi:hypothetical protein
LFGHEREEVTGGWKEVHNMELQSDQFIVRWVGHVACVGEMVLRIPVQNWEDIKMEEIEVVGMLARLMLMWKRTSGGLL